MDLLVRLKFTNKTSKACSAEIITKRSSCKKISEWYASHHTGDRYAIFIDGHGVRQDQNGTIDE